MDTGWGVRIGSQKSEVPGGSKFLKARVRVGVAIRKLAKATPDSFFIKMKNTKNAHAFNHILKSNIKPNVSFKANLIASRNLFHIDHSSDVIDHLQG